MCAQKAVIEDWRPKKKIAIIEKKKRNLLTVNVIIIVGIACKYYSLVPLKTQIKKNKSNKKIVN